MYTAILIGAVSICSIVWWQRYPLKRFWPRLSQKIIGLIGLAAIVGVAGWVVMVAMPGQSFQGDSPMLIDARTEMRSRLESDVIQLSVEIGERNVQCDYQGLLAAAEFVESRFVGLGFEPKLQEFKVGRVSCANIEVEIVGATKPDEIVIIGAHYDSAPGTPGANDNATGTAALLELARSFRTSKPSRTLRFVAFTNEEPPHFQGPTMGSLAYAERCKERGEFIKAAVSLETIGFFTEMNGSQQYPPPFGLVYPSKGNFIGVIGNMKSRRLTRQVISAFRSTADVPSEGGALPETIPGVGWSDHWAFWQHGYPAVMITDTAPFRYKYYHQPEDTPDKLDFDRMTLVVDALPNVIKALTDE